MYVYTTILSTISMVDNTLNTYTYECIHQLSTICIHENMLNICACKCVHLNYAQYV